MEVSPEEVMGVLRRTNRIQPDDESEERKTLESTGMVYAKALGQVKKNSFSVN